MSGTETSDRRSKISAINSSIVANTTWLKIINSWSESEAVTPLQVIVRSLKYAVVVQEQRVEISASLE